MQLSGGSTEPHAADLIRICWGSPCQGPYVGAEPAPTCYLKKPGTGSGYPARGTGQTPTRDSANPNTNETQQATHPCDPLAMTRDPQLNLRKPEVALPKRCLAGGPLLSARAALPSFSSAFPVQHDRYLQSDVYRLRGSGEGSPKARVSLRVPQATLVHITLRAAGLCGPAQRQVKGSGPALHA